MKKIFTLIAALVATLSVNAATLGPEDNSAGWWKVFSDSYTLQEGDKAVISFVNHNKGTGVATNWNNWLAVITKPEAGLPVLDDKGDYVWPNGSPEYGVIRADNFGWGTYFQKDGDDPAGWAATYENDYNWDDFPGLMNGAQVTVTLQQDAEGHLVLEAVTTKDGKNYNYKVASKNALPAGGFGFFFSVEAAHLTDFNVKIETEAVVSAHTYDFTAWSAGTIAALKADAAASKLEGWSDVEKKADAEADAEPTETSKDNCFWCVATPNADGTLSANGVVIKELGNLKFNEAYSTARSLAIAVNYPTALSDYQGGAYLWLGGKEKLCFTIPNVAAGSTITVAAESHKASDARGIQLKQGETQIGADFTPTTYDTYTWTVETAGDVDVYNTNGCHIYYIDIKGGNTGVSEVKAAPAKAQPKKVLTKNGIIIDGKYTIGGALVK